MHIDLKIVCWRPCPPFFHEERAVEDEKGFKYKGLEKGFLIAVNRWSVCMENERVKGVYKLGAGLLNFPK